jgi:hypothetical protein
MEVFANSIQADSVDADVADQRSAPRFTLLIRAARLVANNGEFVCVIRDVSETGLSVRMFHAMPAGDELELYMPGGRRYRIRNVWTREREAGFEFLEPVEVAELINEAGMYPKRGVRIGVHFPATVGTLTERHDALVENLSQQGARFECEGRLAIDQSLRLEGPGFKEVRAKVRWRRDNRYGVVFDDTLALGDFARLAARLQHPALLDD